MSEQQLRNLNEQWVEKGDDGKFHMYKAVEGEYCKGCIFGKMCEGHGLNNIHVCDREDHCPLKFANTVIKDLGILNEQGFLIEERSGQYPDISESDGIFEANLHVTLITPNMAGAIFRVQASSMQRLKDAWNWRSL